MFSEPSWENVPGSIQTVVLLAIFGYTDVHTELGCGGFNGRRVGGAGGDVVRVVVVLCWANTKALREHILLLKAW